MDTIRDLPEDASWQEIEERIRFLAAIEKGRAEVRRGEVVPHEDVRDSPTPSELEAAWIREADERLEAFRQGQIDAVDGASAMVDLRAKFPR